MGRDVTERTVDGEEYTFTQFGATKSMKVLTRLSKIVGEPIGKVAGGIEPGKSMLDQDLDGQLIGAAIKALTDNLDEDVVVNTVKELCSCVLYKGGTLDKTFDIHFQGRLGHLFKVVGAVLEVQYGDFLGALGDIAALTQAGTRQASPMSNGSSGDQSLPV